MAFDQEAYCCCYLWSVSFVNEPIPSGQDFVTINFINCLGVNETITVTSSQGLIQYIPVCTSEKLNSISVTKGTLRVEGQTIISVASTGSNTYTKLQSCSNPLDFIYVTPVKPLFISGISEYNEIPGCWSLASLNAQCADKYSAIINYGLTQKNGYVDCETCLNNNKYYLLTNCGSQYTTIVTQTDLSAYLNRVVKIAGDTNCYSVSLTTFSPNVVAVTVTNDYDDCLDCLPPPPPPAYYLNSCTNNTTYNQIIIFDGANPNGLPNPSTLSGVTLGRFTYDNGTHDIALPGCFNITPAPSAVYPTGIYYTDVVSFMEFESCPQCSAPTFKITTCDESLGLEPWITNTDLLTYVDTTQKIVIENPGEVWPEGTYCVTITRIITEVGVPFTGVIQSNYYASCFECLRVCYLITPCAPSEIQPRIVYNDFAEYVGKIVKIQGCDDVCWTVSIAETCEFGVNVGEVTDSYDTCTECLPVIPVPVFYDVKTGNVLVELLPKELRAEFGDESTDHSMD